ncbi:MAG: NAD(P)/FAD-dependent oxidoreductase [Candidatus Rokubacteria bacterium]|nr:NAD(P)/FAD-dependent oxidoreductase [Candidatus Rokubacteria bacterium]
MAEENLFDGIIIGGGHNGLILQAYLARCGLRTLTVEKNPEVGGGLSTLEDTLNPGFHHNTHAVFLRGLSAMPWYRDLELEKHGVRTIKPELNVALIQRGGRSLRWYLDLDKTCASVAEFSRKDAEAWRRITREHAEIVEKIVEPELASPPLARDKKRALLERSALGRLYLELEPLSPREFAETHFDNVTVRALLLYLCLNRELDVHAPNQGLALPSLIAGRARAELAVGGSATVAQGLRKAVEAAGGQIWEGQTISAIIVEQDRATGIELADGRRVKAGVFIASNLNPHQTLQELVGKDKLNAIARVGLRSYIYQIVGPLFGVHLSLTEPPRYAGRGAHPDLDHAFMTILGLESPEQIYGLHAQFRKGEPASRKVVWGTTPTVFDPSQAPAGKHTAFMWEKVPYHLGGHAENWDQAKLHRMGEILEYWRTFAPNLSDSAILRRLAYSPLDTERHLPNMARGDPGVGWLGVEQRGINRPFPGIPPYRTGVTGLYLCGACTHPGGNITGLPGYNAARVIAEDLTLTPWWNPPDLERLWGALP